jgi:DNA-directed RNA polymerase specialized sigma24 family protein
VQDHRRAGPTESVEVTEQVAVEQVRAGDREAYAVLVRLYAVAARRAAVLFGAGPDAEDVVQTAFLKAYHAFSRFQDGAEFRPWLLRIVINEAKNAARANGWRQPRPPGSPRWTSSSPTTIQPRLRWPATAADSCSPRCAHCLSRSDG